MMAARTGERPEATRREPLHRGLRYCIAAAVAARVPHHGRIRRVGTAIGIPMPAESTASDRIETGSRRDDQPRRRSRHNPRSRSRRYASAARRESRKILFCRRTQPGNRVICPPGRRERSCCNSAPGGARSAIWHCKDARFVENGRACACVDPEPRGPGDGPLENCQIRP